ncbi:MAG: hypothetical protein OXT67_13550 [Zetaproteobacteria bacterium]|nr:hypothetical protein [Zetaproteobacteria bacterium]
MWRFRLPALALLANMWLAWGTAAAESSLDDFGVEKIAAGQTVVLSPELPDEAQNIRREVVVGPGDVWFEDPLRAATQVKFSWPGIYQLKLHHTEGGEAKSEDVQIEVFKYAGAVTVQSEVMKMNPKFYLDFEQIPSGVDHVEKVNASVGRIFTKGDLPQLVSSAKGSGWDFGQTAGHLRLYGNPVLDIGKVQGEKGLTIAFWVKHSYETALDRNSRIAGSVFDIVQNTWGGDEGRIDFNFPAVGVKLISQRQPHPNPLDGEWHHIVVSLDYHSVEDNAKLYVDGKVVHQVSKAITKDFHATRADKALFIGTRPINSHYRPFRGALDDFAVFSYPLTSAQVETLHQYTPGEQSYYPIQVEAGKTITQSLPSSSVTLQGQVHSDDPNPPSLTPVWEQISGPTQASFNDVNRLDPTIQLNPPEHGTYHHYVFRLNVAQGDVPLYDDVSVVLYQKHGGVVRQLSSVPAPGVHPRIFFTPDDLPEMRKRFKDGHNAGIAVEYLSKYINQRLYNPSSAEGKVFAKLSVGDENVDINPVLDRKNVSLYGEGTSKLYSQLMSAGLLALLDEDGQKGAELATALATLARKQMQTYQPLLHQYLGQGVNPDLSLAYDFIHPWMNAEQRSEVRAFLSKMCSYRRAYGVAETARLNSTNWRGHHDHVVVCALGIEGEEGYDPEVYLSNVKRLRDFYTQYGVFDSGRPHEGLDYFLFGQQWASRVAVATSMRDENLFETTSLYKVNEMMYRQVSPWGDYIFTHDDSVSGTLQYVYPPLWVMKYMYPEDSMVDYYVKVLRDTSLQKGQKRKFTLTALMFGLDFDNPEADISHAANALNLPVSHFDPDHGYVNTRTDWSKDALKLEFRNKQDAYYIGHIHSDRNSFELQSHGRDWLIDPGKYMMANDYTQTILIDGIGQADSEAKRRWPSMPGKFLEYVDQPSFTLGAGDAKPNYDYHRKPNVSGDTYVDSPFTWSEFTFNKQDMEPWFFSEKVGAGNTGKLGVYNPVEKAFRTVTLIRGAHPYVLVVDDIQKDAQPHEYEWVANVANDFHAVGYPTVEMIESSETTAVIRYVHDTKPDDPRLLFKVLQGEGEASAIELRERTNLGQNKKYKRKWVSITRKNVVEPKFKMLLFPHRGGEAQPEVEWAADGQSLTLTIGSQVDTVRFACCHAEGRSTLSVERDGKVLGSNMVSAAPPAE